MKLALIQCDVRDGDLRGNCGKILQFVRKAADADLCILPAGAITGPSGMVADSSEAPCGLVNTLDWLAGELPDGTGLLGHETGTGYFLAYERSWRPVEHLFNFGGLRLGMDLCPDDASAIDLGIAMLPRAFAPGANDEWELILSGFCRQNAIWVASVNLCGGYGSDIYAGQSMVVGPDGVLAAKARAFGEDCLLADISMPGLPGRIEPAPACREEAMWSALTLGLRDFVAKASASDVLLGLSGGMDSSLVACVAAEALGPEHVTGVLMPSPYTSRESIEDAYELARNLRIRSIQIPITPMLESFGKNLEPALAMLSPRPGEVSGENLQARLRGVILMTLSNYCGALTLNCGNKSEGAMGYCTLYGDTVGAVAVIGDIFKTQVYELASWFCVKAGAQIIPRRVFEKEPSAELRPGQKDTDSLPPYAELDPRLAEVLQAPRSQCDRNDSHLRELSEHVARFAFKRRQSPPVLRVSGLPLDQFK